MINYISWLIIVTKYNNYYIEVPNAALTRCGTEVDVSSSFNLSCIDTYIQLTRVLIGLAPHMSTWYILILQWLKAALRPARARGGDPAQAAGMSQGDHVADAADARRRCFIILLVINVSIQMYYMANY